MTDFNPLDMPIFEIDEATKAEKTSRFEASRFLDNPVTISAFLAEAMREGDSEHLMEALGEVAKAVGINKIAQEAGVNRESLYKTFKQGTKPRFETVVKVLEALGVELAIKPKNQTYKIDMEVMVPRFTFIGSSGITVHNQKGWFDGMTFHSRHGNDDSSHSEVRSHGRDSTGRFVSSNQGRKQRKDPHKAS